MRLEGERGVAFGRLRSPGTGRFVDPVEQQRARLSAIADALADSGEPGHERGDARVGQHVGRVIAAGAQRAAQAPACGPQRAAFRRRSVDDVAHLVHAAEYRRDRIAAENVQAQAWVLLAQQRQQRLHHHGITDRVRRDHQRSRTHRRPRLGHRLCSILTRRRDCGSKGRREVKGQGGRVKGNQGAHSPRRGFCPSPFPLDPSPGSRQSRDRPSPGRDTVSQYEHIAFPVAASSRYTRGCEDHSGIFGLGQKAGRSEASISTTSSCAGCSCVAESGPFIASALRPGRAIRGSADCGRRRRRRTFPAAAR